MQIFTSSFIAALLIFLPATFFSQTPNRTNIKATVKDTTGEAIPFATVMLLNVKDTTLVNFTRTDEKGIFSFKNVKNSPYLLKITYLGFLPFNQRLEPSPEENTDLGVLTIKPISSQLLEVVIKAAKAPLRIRGDTIEYDATTFKVPPGATVEDLLRRLPGIDVDAEGNIKAQGKDVKRVYVDGKTFFGDDPKMATQNLDAQVISKVQVYNDKSEQAKITGVDDGKKEKAMNLELKDEYKKGAFGKVTAAVGDHERWAGRGNYNRFTPTKQLSFIGFGNNINQTGVNWQDYGEFRGQSNNDEWGDSGDFGFSSGGRIFRYYFDEEENVSLRGWSSTRGLSKNYGLGTNFNYDNKKTEFNTNYFYKETATDLEQFSERQTFFSDQIFRNTDTTLRHEFRGNHALAARVEQEIDSSNSLIVKANGRFSLGSNSNLQSQLFSGEDNLPTNSFDISNRNDIKAWRFGSLGIFRHRFAKKGRTAAISAGFNGSDNRNDENLFSLKEFFQASTPTDQARILNAGKSKTTQVKSSALFSDAISKRWFWEGFYNFSLAENIVDRQATDGENGNSRLDDLSIFYDNKLMFNRLGFAPRYSHEGMNITAGMAGIQMRLQGKYSVAENLPDLAPPIDRTFRYLSPHFNFDYETKSHLNVSFGYDYSVREPNLRDLQPVPNVSNPAFQTSGNPNLEPERGHAFNFGLHKWDSGSFGSFGLNGGLNFYDNQVVYNQSSSIVSGSLQTVSTPDNASGGFGANAYLWSSFPLIKTKLTLNLGGNLNQNRNTALVDGDPNETDNFQYGGNISLTYTPAAPLILSIGSDINRTNLKYSFREDQNQKILNTSGDASLKWMFLKKTFFEGNFDYSLFQNERFDFEQSVPILNASVRRLFGKTNRLEVRLAAFDLLNKRLNINQFGNQNYVNKSVTNTLTRYFMLSVSYNVRGYEDKLKKNDWW